MYKIKTPALFGITHFFIDAACIALLYYIVKNGFAEGEYAFTLIVVYNVIAFGAQSIIGYFFDKTGNAKLCAITGCILTAASVMLFRHPLYAAVTAGFGNAFFHVGGGIICLKDEEKKASIAGMYVAPGALGLFAGGLTVNYTDISPVLFIPFLLLSSIFIYKFQETSSVFSDKIKIDKAFTITLFMLTAIALRSFTGLSAVLPFKDNFIYLVLLTSAIFAGKFFGGIIADKFGFVKTTVTALLISSPLVGFCLNYPLLYIIGIFFFNFTMPVTLTVTANVMQKREGFAFGLTTLALLAGALPVFAGINTSAENSVIIFSLIIFSALCIYCGLTLYEKKSTRI